MNMAPDSHRYLALGSGQRVARPFNRRILFPWLCGSDVSSWQWLSYSSFLLLPLLTGVYVYMQVHSLIPALFAIFLMVGMPQMKFWYATPVLGDAASMCIAIIAAILPFPANLIVAAVGGFARETVPLFAALYAWNPILLLGLIPVGIYALYAPVGPDQMGRDEWLKHPFRTAQMFKVGKWRDAGMLVTPWGSALVALWFPSFQLICTLVVAYAQLFVATDAARLFIWAAPVMLSHAAQINSAWMLPLVVFHWVNPMRGEGY